MFRHGAVTWLDRLDMTIAERNCAALVVPVADKTFFRPKRRGMIQPDGLGVLARGGPASVIRQLPDEGSPRGVSMFLHQHELLGRHPDLGRLEMQILELWIAGVEGNDPVVVEIRAVKNTVGRIAEWVIKLAQTSGFPSGHVLVGGATEQIRVKLADINRERAPIDILAIGVSDP